jgi:hypothetical protein
MKEPDKVRVRAASTATSHREAADFVDVDESSVDIGPDGGTGAETRTGEAGEGKAGACGRRRGRVRELSVARRSDGRAAVLAHRPPAGANAA